MSLTQEQQIVDLYSKFRALADALGKHGIPLINSADAWTPTIGGSTGDGTVSYSAHSGYYTRVGGLCLLSGVIAIDTITAAPTGDLQIKGLPVTALNVDAARNVGQAWTTGLNWGTGKTDVMARIYPNNNYIRVIAGVNDGSMAAVACTGLSNGDIIEFSILCHVA